MIARIIISEDPAKLTLEINNSLKQIGLPKNNPDLFYLDSSQKLGIETARKIKQYFNLKPHTYDGKVVILEDASKLTPEAQNSLLKTIEEAPEKSLIILGAHSLSAFLPTVLSRCQVIKLQEQKTELNAETRQEITNLLQGSIEERFAFIEKQKDRKKLLSDLVFFFRELLIKQPKNKELAEYTKKLLQAQEWTASNTNIRAIEEYLMLVMPTIKW